MKERQLPMDRRDFLQAALAGGGLLLGVTFTLTPLAEAAGAPPAAASRTIVMNAWVRIGTDDTVTLVVGQAEIGQGTGTTLPAVLADELGADWSRVRFESCPADPAYRNPRNNWQFTGNSESITGFFDIMREMGATAREALIGAAAARWRVQPATCEAQAGKVVHRPSGRRFTFGELAEEAARRPRPKSPSLRPWSELKLVGRTVPRVDIPDKVTGKAVFGIDAKVPGMAHAAVRACPVFGGKVRSFDRAAIQGRAGILAVVELPAGVAVVAERYWQAKTALDALRIDWDDGPHGALSSATLAAQYREAMDGSSWLEAVSAGDSSVHNDASLEAFSQEYASQFLAHATMEPMNATAHATAEGCDVWVPTQGQEMTLLSVSAALGLPKEKVRIHRLLSGGGFGRRLLADFAVQAALCSKAVGRPVKVLWSRDEDMLHSFYRPGVLNRLIARLDGSGKPVALTCKIVSPSQLQYVAKRAVTDVRDPTCLEGMVTTRYAIPSWRTDLKLLKIGVPTSVLRTTGYGPNIFALESFIDELAHKAKKDPYLYRRELLSADSRALAVLDAAADRSGWKQPPPPGRARGIAFCQAFNTLMAHVVELSVQGEAVTVHRVTSVMDAGTVIDPGNSANQVEGGAAWGLGVAFKTEITFDKGRAAQRNWHDYFVATLPEMPPVDAHFIDSGARPLGGIGEAGPVTIVPALVNALYVATGRRIRSLPLRRHGFRWSPAAGNVPPEP